MFQNLLHVWPVQHCSVVAAAGRVGLPPATRSSSWWTSRALFGVQKQKLYWLLILGHDTTAALSFYRALAKLMERKFVIFDWGKKLKLKVQTFHKNLPQTEIKYIYISFISKINTPLLNLNKYFLYFPHGYNIVLTLFRGANKVSWLGWYVDVLLCCAGYLHIE